MLGVTGFGLLFTPAFYTFVRSLGRRGGERNREFVPHRSNRRRAPPDCDGLKSGTLCLLEGSNHDAHDTREGSREPSADCGNGLALVPRKGFDGVGLDAIMKEAGLTHGGFYGHFASKEDLAAEAVARALEESAGWQSRYANVADFVSDYLSESHFADRANGCVLAALGGDMARRGEEVRSGVTFHVRTALERLAGLCRGTATARRRRAIATLAGVVGAMTLARAVEDPGLSDEILSAAREVFGSARPTP
jgi:TetR/AcrR family transcriptional repressor of nem operon